MTQKEGGGGAAAAGERKGEERAGGPIEGEGGAGRWNRRWIRRRRTKRGEGGVAMEEEGRGGGTEKGAKDINIREYITKKSSLDSSHEKNPQILGNAP